MKILVINGPNLNLLGVREPEIYGSGDYAGLKRHIRAAAKAAGVRVRIFRSNCEGRIVTRIQRAWGHYDAIVINPAAYTHTSVAILDALRAAGVPAAEVHLSEPMEREDFRRVSYAGMACEARFAGMGFESYAAAIRYFAEKAKRA
jgi:3-dehydroquinate dehydratase-2